MKLSRVAENGPERIRKTASNGDLFRKRFFGDFRHVLEERRGLQEQTLSLSAAGESQDLLDDVGAALSAGFDRRKDRFVVGIHFGAAEHGCSHQDRSQNVIQVMGAARESADAFQPLRAE